MDLSATSMRVVFGSHSLGSPPLGAVLTIGNFDGVHRGHRFILSNLAERAAEVGGTACLLTFDPPPSRVVGRRQPVPQITTLEDRQWLASEVGLDCFVVEPFTHELAAYPPERFVREILHGCFRPAEVWVGYDFAFGRNREGDAGFLERWFADGGTRVRQLHAVTGEGGEIISSTRVRQRVALGDVAGAAELLGRPHFVRGRVVEGDRRGRLLGFPTANLDPMTELLPAPGVYAAWFSVDGQVHPAVTNVGNRPTFSGEGVRVEAHLLGFSGDLYGREVTVWFAERLREERRFEGVDALVTQIRADAADAASRLSGAPVPALAAASTLPR